MAANPAPIGTGGLVLLIFPRPVCLVSRRNATTSHNQTDGNFNQQQGVPGLWCAHHQPGPVHEVLSHQSGWAAGGKDGAVAPELQAAR